MTDEARKEEWISQYIFMSGVLWSDPPPTLEEAEAEWDARQRQIQQLTLPIAHLRPLS